MYINFVECKPAFVFFQAIDLPKKVKEISRQHGHNLKKVDLVVKLYNNSVLNVPKQLTMLGLLATCFPKVFNKLLKIYFLRAIYIT